MKSQAKRYTVVHKSKICVKKFSSKRYFAQLGVTTTCKRARNVFRREKLFPTACGNYPRNVLGKDIFFRIFLEQKTENFFVFIVVYFVLSLQDPSDNKYLCTEELYCKNIRYYYHCSSPLTECLTLVRPNRRRTTAMCSTF